MKIQCNVCETAEANVLCCADEAALCWGCDEKVHAANKLASKHQRVPLTTSSPHFPKCDICQVPSSFITSLIFQNIFISLGRWCFRKWLHLCFKREYSLFVCLFVFLFVTIEICGISFFLVLCLF